MFQQARAQQRTIPGAVATVGVNERVAFLRRTYGHLAAAILAFVAVAYFMVNSEFGARFTLWAFGGQLNWLLVLGLFMVVGFISTLYRGSHSSVRGSNMLDELSTSSSTVGVTSLVSTLRSLQPISLPPLAMSPPTARLAPTPSMPPSEGWLPPAPSLTCFIRRATLSFRRAPQMKML